MSDVARFEILPPLRCCQQVPDLEIQVCGEPAVCERRGPSGHQIGFYCAAHSRGGDQPIDRQVLLRRVSVVVEVTFAGVSPIQGMAHAEAVARLELAVAKAGGLMNLTTVTSAVGRYEPPPAPVRTRGGRGKAL